MDFGVLHKFWIFSVKYLCPIVFFIIVTTYLYDNIKNPYGGYPVSNLLVAGWGFVAVTFAFSIVMTFFKDKVAVEDSQQANLED